MIYFDHATTSLPRNTRALNGAIQAATLVSPKHGLSGIHSEASNALARARQAVRDLVGFGESIFLSSATHSLNQAILGWKPKPLVIAIDASAHNATRRPALRMGVPVWTLPHDEMGRIDLDRLDACWEHGTGLVILTHGCSISGLLQPVIEVAEFAQRKGAAVVVDAAQSVGKVSPLELGPVDAVALCGHKGLRGLPGTGALVIDSECDIDPLITGGLDWDDEAEDMPEDYPYRLEAGSSNFPGAIAMGQAAADAMDSPWAWRSCAGRLEETVRGAGITQIWSGELPVLSFVIDGLSPQEVETRLHQDFDIVVSSGTHSAPGAHQILGTPDFGTVRVSAAHDTDDGDFEALHDALMRLR